MIGQEKNSIIIKLLKAVSICLFIMTPLFIHWTYIDRGYFAIGGEVVAWVIPLLICIELEHPVEREVK